MPGHEEVGEHHRDGLRAQQIQRLRPAARGDHPQRLLLEDLLQGIDDAGLVVHHQDRRGLRLAWGCFVHHLAPVRPHRNPDANWLVAQRPAARHFASAHGREL
jgi:hypothetical protein